MSYAAPAAHPLCRSLVISDDLHRIQVTLSQVHFQPYPDLCVVLVGGCLLLIPSESQRSFVGAEEDRRERERDQACRLSEKHTRMVFAEQERFASV